MSGITKTLVAILIVVIASVAAGIGYFAATHPPSPNASTTSSEPTFSPTPTSTFRSAPPQTSTPISPTTTPATSVNSTPRPSELPTQEKVRDSVMSFIRLSHPETAQFMENLAWTGGRVTLPNIVGAETNMYYSQGWNITISYPMVPNAIYKIAADYSASGISIPYRIIWKGTSQNEIINETSYVFAQ